jgi:NADH-quinone oxidoreductase chain G
MSNDFEITIDGRTTGVQKGETILQVALRLGIEIPVFCWHPKIDPVGACRMCLVEVEKMPKLVVACATPAAPNMVVHTHNERVEKARKGVIEFLLIDHPLDCPTCDKGGECMLQDNVYHHGLDRSRFTETKHRFEREERFFLDDAVIGPQIVRNQNRCIRCYRCTRFTQEVAGEGDLGVFNRGWHTEIDTLPDREIGNLYSGNTVEICPVGALMSEDFRYTTRPWVSYRTPSICNLCPDGCNLTLWNNRRELFRATSRAHDEIDEGWICDRGRYAYAYRESPVRITTPQRGDGEKWAAIGWDEAITGAAAALREALDRHGPGAVGGLVSPHATNESIYLFQRFFRSVLSSNSVDWRTDRKRLVSPERRRRNRAFPRQTRPITQLERTQLIMAFGCDLENERPITSLRALKAQRKFGARLVLINDRPTRLRRRADREYIYKPGSEKMLWAGLLRIIAECRGSDTLSSDLRAQLKTVSLNAVTEHTGLTRAEVEQLGEGICAARSCIIYMGRDIRQSPDQEAIVDLALAAAEVLELDGGEKGAIELSPEFANALGATMMGGEPEVLPGGVDAHDTTRAAHLAELWGAPLPAAGGYDGTEMLEAAHDERLKALFLLGNSPIFHYPDSGWAESAVARLDCVVAMGQFDLGRPGFAHYFLPTATVHEDPGTFLSGEGRLQYSEAAVRIAGDARPVRDVLSDLAQALGRPWSFPSAQSVFGEMCKAIPAFSGLSHPGLRDSGGHRFDLNQYAQDTASLFADAAAVLTSLSRAPESARAEGRYLLQTGNVGHHFADLTVHSQPIMNFASVPYALLHPDDCSSLGLEPGSWVRVASSRGDIEVIARPSPLVMSGMILIPAHFPQAHPNRLRDRAAKADYVRIERIEGREPDALKPKVAVSQVGAWTH